MYQEISKKTQIALEMREVTDTMELTDKKRMIRKCYE